MIVKLKGIIDKITADFLVVDTGSLAYKVFAPGSVLEKCRAEEEVVLWTHQVVREDNLSLYGLLTFEDLQTFELLLSVSGVGPKMALGVLSAAGTQEIQRAILQGDTSLFTRVSGIGKRGASRIVIDLKSKIDSLEDLDLTQLGEIKERRELMEALKELGYKASEVQEVVRQVDAQLGLEEQVRKALKMLGSNTKF